MLATRLSARNGGIKKNNNNYQTDLVFGVRPVDALPWLALSITQVYAGLRTPPTGKKSDNFLRRRATRAPLIYPPGAQHDIKAQRNPPTYHVSLQPIGQRADVGGAGKRLIQNRPMGDSATAALGLGAFVRACLPLTGARLFTSNLFPSSLPPAGKKAMQDGAAAAGGGGSSSVRCTATPQSQHGQRTAAGRCLVCLFLRYTATWWPHSDASFKAFRDLLK